MTIFDFNKVFNQFAAATTTMSPAHLIAARNTAIHDEFIKAVARANWRLLRRADIVEPHQVNHLIIIGIALWSNPDLHALNELAEKLIDKNITVFVFDIDEYGFS